VIETRRKDTGAVCEIRYVEKCCRTCKHWGDHPDGCGECAALVDYEDGLPYVAEKFDFTTQGMIPCESYPMVGASNICDAWEQKTLDTEDKA